MTPVEPQKRATTKQHIQLPKPEPPPLVKVEKPTKG
jgi:hypothetical protein